MQCPRQQCRSGASCPEDETTARRDDLCHRFGAVLTDTFWELKDHRSVGFRVFLFVGGGGGRAG